MNIRHKLLVEIRLSSYFWIFFGVFCVLSFQFPSYTFNSGTLALFSVNSFLYGFYISPILGAQKARIEDLHRILRAEANAIFSIVLKFKKLPKELRNDLQQMVTTYISAKLKAKKPNSGESEYEKLITFCIEYKGEHQEDIDKTLDALVANQQNRTNFNMQVASKVYANEWHIMVILFSITLGFILALDIGHSPVLLIIRALLCTALTMLVLILIKLSTLTHKKAKQMWEPLNKLVDTNYYRVD
jgi:hypothetical protein